MRDFKGWVGGGKDVAGAGPREAMFRRKVNYFGDSDLCSQLCGTDCFEKKSFANFSSPIAVLHRDSEETLAASLIYVN